jgi:hypothetical protein
LISLGLPIATSRRDAPAGTSTSYVRTALSAMLGRTTRALRAQRVGRALDRSVAAGAGSGLGGHFDGRRHHAGGDDCRQETGEDMPLSVHMGDHVGSSPGQNGLRRRRVCRSFA